MLAKGTWEAKVHSLYMDGSGQYKIGVPGNPSVVFATMETTEANFVALMSPPVALALADLLEVEAAVADIDVQMVAEPAYRLARAILREDDPR